MGKMGSGLAPTPANGTKAHQEQRRELVRTFLGSGAGDRLVVIWPLGEGEGTRECFAGRIGLFSSCSPSSP